MDACELACDATMETAVRSRPGAAPSATATNPNCTSRDSTTLTENQVACATDVNPDDKLSAMAMVQSVSAVATPITGRNATTDRGDSQNLALQCKNVSDGVNSQASMCPKLLPSTSESLCTSRLQDRPHGQAPNAVTLDSSIRLPAAVIEAVAKLGKPDCSYSCLIGMALFAHGRLTVGGIYSYIKYHFPYFMTTAPEGWKNSVRHSLSLGTYFCKVATLSKLQKGFYWEITSHGRERLKKEVVNFIKAAQPHNQFLNPNFPTLKDLNLEEPIPSHQDCHGSQETKRNGSEPSTVESHQAIPMGVAPPLAVAPVTTLQPSVSPTTQRSTQPETDQSKTPQPPTQRSAQPETDHSNSVQSPTQWAAQSETDWSKTLQPSELPTKTDLSQAQISADDSEAVEVTVLLDSLTQMLPQQEGHAYTECGLAPTSAPVGPLEESTKLENGSERQQRKRAAPVIATAVHNSQPALKEEELYISVDDTPEELAPAGWPIPKLCALQEKEMDGQEFASKEVPVLAGGHCGERKGEKKERSCTRRKSSLPVQDIRSETQGSLNAQKSFEPDPKSGGMNGAPPLSTAIAQPSLCAMQLPSTCHSLAMPQRLPQAHVPSFCTGIQVPPALPEQANTKQKPKKRRGRKPSQKPQAQPQQRILPTLPRMTYACMPHHRFMPYPLTQLWSAHQVPHPHPAMNLQSSFYQMPGTWQYPYATSGQYCMSQAQVGTVPAKEGCTEGQGESCSPHNPTYQQQLQTAWYYTQLGMQHMLHGGYYQGGLYPYSMQGFQNLAVNSMPYHNHPSLATARGHGAPLNAMPIPVLSTTHEPPPQSHGHEEDQEQLGEEPLSGPNCQKKPKLQRKQKRTKGKAKAAGKRQEAITHTSDSITETPMDTGQQSASLGAEEPLESLKQVSSTEANPSEQKSDVEQVNGPPVSGKDNPPIHIVPDGFELDVDQLIQALEQTEHYLKLQIHQAAQAKGDTSTAVPKATNGSSQWSDAMLTPQAVSNDCLSEAVSSEGLTIVHHADTEVYGTGQLRLEGHVGERKIGPSLAGTADEDELPLVGITGDELPTPSPVEPPESIHEGHHLD